MFASPIHRDTAALAHSRDIRTAKEQLVRHRLGIDNAKAHIAHMEARLSAMDPQRVVACVVTGYIDPPERVKQALADKAAGIHTVIGRVCTPDVIRAYHAGTLKIPEFDGFFHAIHDLKQRIVHTRTAVRDTELHNASLESGLSRLDPQAVVAAKAAGYVDPPETVRAAAHAATQGSTP